MSDDAGTADVLALTAQIVSAHVSKNNVAPDALPALIQDVYRTLSTVGREPAQADKPTPAVPVKKSIFPDHIICLEDGKKLKMLPWGEYGFDGYGYSLFASDKLIAEKPDVVKRFTKAYLKTIELALKDKADVAKTMKEIFPEMDVALVLQQFETIVPLIENSISKAEGIGTIDKVRLAKTWEWTAKAQDMKLDKMDPESAVDRAFLAK